MTSPALGSLVDAIWYGRSPLAALLLPPAWLYGGLVRLRRWAYETGVFRVPRLRLPVIVVGNVTVGGTGKTPVVVWLAARLAERGFRVGIVSRGYGGNESAEPRLVGADSSATEVGDEPVLLARLTGCPVVVCTRRVRAVERLYTEAVDVVLADDGLQHYALDRVAELAVVDGARSFGNGFMLPAGPLREPVQRVRECDAVLTNGAARELPAALEFKLRIRSARELAANASRPLQDFAGQRVWGVAGIGNPDRFFGDLRAWQLQVDEVRPGDHGQTDLAALRAKRQQPILMTEKDAVKYTDAPADAWAVPAELEFTSDAGAVERLLRRLEGRVARFSGAEGVA